jgi:hypothetical protein
MVGLAMGVGAATVKLVLLYKCRTNYGFLHIYLKAAKSITRLIITGMILLTLSGIGWIIMGYSFSTLFIVKLVLVGVVWLLGPIIDNLIEPAFIRLVPLTGENATPEFVRIQKQYLAIEITATMLMYAITIIGVVL